MFANIINDSHHDASNRASGSRMISKGSISPQGCYDKIHPPTKFQAFLMLQEYSISERNPEMLSVLGWCFLVDYSIKMKY